MEITYYANIDSMGDTSEAQAEKFREWARAEIARAYPDADVNVTDEQSLQTASVYCGDDYEQEEEALDFCSRLWDRCPWDWDVSE